MEIYFVYAFIIAFDISVEYERMPAAVHCFVLAENSLPCAPRYTSLPESVTLAARFWFLLPKPVRLVTFLNP